MHSARHLSVLTRRIGSREEESFFNGDGKGKPLGILAATGGAEVGVTAASATAITADEVIDLFYRLEGSLPQECGLVTE